MRVPGLALRYREGTVTSSSTFIDHHFSSDPFSPFCKTQVFDEDTLIVFTSDNGPENSWRKRIKEFGHDSSSMFRGGKRDIYEGGYRAPFLINHGASGRFSIMEGSWKLILPHKNAGPELCDLARDPGEEDNVMEQQREVAKPLEQKITDIVRRGRTNNGTPQRNDTGYWDHLTWMDESVYESK